MGRRHEWVEDCRHEEWVPAGDGFMCAECDATSPACVVLRDGQAHPTGSSLLICDPCLTAEKHVLDDIEAALAQVELTPPPTLQAIRYDRDQVHGGEPDHMPSLEPVEAADLEHINDVLWSWVAAWTDLSGDVQQVGATEYLTGHFIWAAHNRELSGWDDYRREIRKLRHTARQAAGLLPQREEVPCVHCGGTVVRDWADEAWRANLDGLSDRLRCTRCGITWGDPAGWAFATRHHLRELPKKNPGALVTLQDTRLIWPDVPPTTINSWVQQDFTDTRPLVPLQGFDQTGAPLYRVGDITALIKRRLDPTRPGRPANKNTE